MITFQDKVSLNTDPTVPDINKIKDSDINSLKAGINTNETDINDIKTKTNYSTSETQTNKKWINNKPIYRKVIQLTPITTTNTDVNTATGITNMEDLISINGLVKISLGWIPLNFHNQNATQYSIISWLQNNMNFTQRSWFTTTGGYAVLEYTKTTD